MMYFIEATQELILDEGLEKLSIKKIAEKAGYNSATIYNYFENLEVLILYASINYLKDYLNDLKNEIELYKETELQTLISYINIVVRGSARNLANVLTSSYEIALQNNSLKIEKKYIDAALSTLAL